MTGLKNNKHCQCKLWWVLVSGMGLPLVMDIPIPVTECVCIFELFIMRGWFYFGELS